MLTHVAHLRQAHAALLEVSRCNGSAFTETGAERVQALVSLQCDRVHRLLDDGRCVADDLINLTQEIRICLTGVELQQLESVTGAAAVADPGPKPVLVVEPELLLAVTYRTGRVLVAQRLPGDPEGGQYLNPVALGGV